MDVVGAEVGAVFEGGVPVQAANPMLLMAIAAASTHLINGVRRIGVFIRSQAVADRQPIRSSTALTVEACHLPPP